jgi:hypothetical protein
MRYIHIVNWEKSQHYKNRKPPWIRLYVDIVDEFDSSGQMKKFYTLSDAAKLTLILLLCYRAKFDIDNGNIPYPNEAWLKAKLGIQTVDLEPLVKAGYIVLKGATEEGSKELPPAAMLQTPPQTPDTVDNKRFSKPTAKEVANYAKSIEFDLDGQQFIDYYESKGWLVGKSKMKDWRAAVRTWKTRRSQSSTSCQRIKPSFSAQKSKIGRDISDE